MVRTKCLQTVERKCLNLNFENKHCKSELLWITFTCELSIMFSTGFISADNTWYLLTVLILSCNSFRVGALLGRITTRDRCSVVVVVVVVVAKGGGRPIQGCSGGQPTQGLIGHGHGHGHRREDVGGGGEKVRIPPDRGGWGNQGHPWHLPVYRGEGERKVGKGRLLLTRGVENVDCL